MLIPIPADTRERNAARFARFCSLLSRRLKITDGFRATWIREDREQMKGTHGLDKLSNLIFHTVLNLTMLHPARFLSWTNASSNGLISSF